jgi:hypothetical protein
MTSIGDLTRVVAHAEDYDENFVSVYARSAREAGFITHRGRGRSAAVMTSRDAANLLIALNGAALAKDAPNAIAVYRKMEASRYIDVDEEVPSFLRHLIEPGTNFGDALERLIEMLIPGSSSDLPLDQHLGSNILSNIEVSFNRPRVYASIKIELHAPSKEDPPLDGTNDFYLEGFEDEALQGGREEKTTINLVTLMAVGRSLAT